jgi:hypothetical protein
VDHHIIREPLKLHARVLPGHPEIEAVMSSRVAPGNFTPRLPRNGT